MSPWISLDTWLVSLLSIAYLLLLFIVAYKGQVQNQKMWLNRPWVYGLSIAVSCSSWAFYGTVGQAATTGYWLAPIYIGTILCFIFAWPMLLRILRITKQLNLTSIADFIACRYDRSPSIAAMVTIVTLLGTIPYIALQLRAISKSFDLLTGTYQSSISTTFFVTLVLIIFSILFGARQIAINKQNQGLVFAIAFSSIIKLCALTAIGLFTTFYVFDGFHDLFAQHQALETKSINTSEANQIYFVISHALIGVATVFILPQQFHMLMIENHHEKELKTARWLYPLYLLLINLFILPIAIAGQNLFPGGSVAADSFVLTIPLFFHQPWLAGFTYIGGLAAATSMIIVATIVLSNMVSTEVVNPLLFNYKNLNEKNNTKISSFLLNIRRLTIVLLLLLALAFERVISQQSLLASIGLLSFVLLAQLTPLVIGALYWKKSTTKAALIALSIGSVTWFYTLLIPTIWPDSAWITNGPFNQLWLKPTALFGFNELDNISHGLFFSLITNSIFFIVISFFSHRSVGEKLQTGLFINKQYNSFERKLTIKDLYLLLQRFVNKDCAESLFNQLTHQYDYRSQKILNQRANDTLINYTQLQLSSVLGSASTRMVMKAVTKQKEIPLEDVVNIVDEANKLFEFNRELLQAGVENIDQGISVVDADMRLVAWNKRYIELLNYPEEFVYVGKSIEDLIRYHLTQGVIVNDDHNNTKDSDFINRRINHMRSGHNHYFQREMPSGIVLEINGKAMPGGGFVSTFTDITAHIKAEQTLKQANEDLEQRVENRTIALTKAKAEAEAANRSKTRFMAATSHDLMQPFNALSLFTSMLNKKVQGTDLEELSNNIQQSLVAAETLLSDLVEISRLDSGVQKIDKQVFAVDQLLTPLNNEFVLLAGQANLRFKYIHSTCLINTDPHLLRRIIQNFLSNAVNYCAQKNISGRVILGVRHQGSHLVIEVHDNGPGIPSDKQKAVFKEFERLQQTSDISGLGLGLAISDRIAKLLSLKISLKSTVDKGSCFSIYVPRVLPSNHQHELDKVTSLISIEHEPKSVSDLSNVPIMVVDNEVLILNAITAQLKEWGCRVIAVKNEDELMNSIAGNMFIPEIIISDYHLNDAKNGIDLIEKVKEIQSWNCPTIICSADPSETVRDHTLKANFHFIRKPVKALGLKKLILRLLR